MEKGDNEEELLDELIEEHIEDDDDEEFMDELVEEHLIVDGHVQSTTTSGGVATMTEMVLNPGEQILGTEDYDDSEDQVDDGEFFVTEAGQLYETQEGTVRYIKIDFDQNDKNGWMKMES